MGPQLPTVYVIDDDREVLKAMERLLGSVGLRVAAFESPRAFLDTYDAAAPGCLVLDLAMPELTGLELQRALAGRDALLMKKLGVRSIADLVRLAERAGVGAQDTGS